MTDGLLTASASQLQLKQLRFVQDLKKIKSLLYQVLVQQGEMKFLGELNVK